MNKKWKISAVIFSLFFTVLCGAENSQIELLAGVKLNLAYEQSIDLSSISVLSNDEICDIKNDEIDNIDLALETPLLFSDMERVAVYVKPEKNAEIGAYLSLPQNVKVIKIKNGFAKVRIEKELAGWIFLRNIENKKFKKKYQEQAAKAKHYVWRSQQKNSQPIVFNQDQNEPMLLLPENPVSDNLVVEDIIAASNNEKEEVKGEENENNI